ncbi:sulfite exporter TauE/SafE family protein [Haloterrigena alkaliphila]|uniref:Sulfite exporter TauE/SafE family protein n=1 Tax=Haloterrigena alkaliphila TaxID=2816475 RepID=A0A8A2VKL1_9EURY|nr:sulfite exporter TauE/SafE family protein [Haloterrigena alkaliphila]QSX01168.1 sulfite exporter TauE/SafE family protein [Haloterrigena alkaliphila]
MEPAMLARVDLALFFGIGVLGGAHCIGMCGPVVSMYDDARSRGPSSGRLSTRAIYQHSLFNIGRTTGYATLGGLFGALGSVLYLTMETLLSVTNAIRGSVGVVLGVLIICHGIGSVVGRHGSVLHKLPIPGLSIDRLVNDASNRLGRIADGPGIVGLGLVHGLVPCPMLYAAFVYVFAVGSPTVGIAALAAFGLGTVPAVFLYGTALGSLDPIRRARLHRVLGVAFVILGYVLFAHGVMALGVHLPHPQLPHYSPTELQGGGHQ